MGTYSLLPLRLIYAGRMILLALASSSRRCALHPATRATAPYRDLACVVMRGNLAAFRDVVQRKQTCFQEDGLLRIVSRQVAERG